MKTKNIRDHLMRKYCKKMDVNDDGKLSKEEVKGPMSDRFDKIDLNEDGFITKEEFDKALRPKSKKV